MSEARNTVVPFGKHKGRTLNDVASSTAGLLYLDKQRAREWVRDTHPEFSQALEAYLSEPGVSREIDRAVGL